MTAAVRVGVVGTGFGARVVAPVFDETDGCAVVDVVSARDQQAVTALCRNPRVDLVAVHSPPFLHVAHVTEAVEAGKAVLCDKPFGRDATEADAMLALAADAGVLHLLNFEFRYDPSRSILRELVASGTLGDVQQVAWTHVSAGSRVPLRPHGWLFDRHRGGGWIGAWASHAVDTLRTWLGDLEVVASSTRLDVAVRPGPDGGDAEGDAEDGLHAILRSARGATMTIASTFAAPATIAPRIVVVGSDAVAESVADGTVVVRRVGGDREEHPVPASDGDRHQAPMRRWAAVVRDAVRAGRAPDGAPTFADGAAVARVLDALRARPAFRSRTSRHEGDRHDQTRRGR